MFLETQFAKYTNEDIGKLILRISTAGLMLFHGFQKYTGGIAEIKELVVSSGLPEIVAYGSYLGELIIPFLLILGVFTRTSALIFGTTMVFALLLVHSDMLLAIDPESGGLMTELPLLYLFSSLALFFLGAGKYSLDARISQCGCLCKKTSH